MLRPRTLATGTRRAFNCGGGAEFRTEYASEVVGRYKAHSADSDELWEWRLAGAHGMCGVSLLAG